MRTFFELRPLTSAKLCAATAATAATAAVVAVVAVAATLSGQGAQAAEKSTLGPRSFFPSEYTTEYFVDVDALQNTDLWDLIERSLITGTLFGKFHREFGYRIRHIRRLRSAGVVLRDEGMGDDESGRQVMVTVIEGEDKLCLPPIKAVEEFSYLQLTEATVAGYKIVSEAPSQPSPSWPERLYVVPRKGCLVAGDAAMIRSVLCGQRRGGVISSKLMALTAQRHPLAYMAMAVPQPDSPRYDTDVPFDTNWLTEDDPLQFFMVRLNHDQETETFNVTATMRFASGRHGPGRLEEGLKASLEGQLPQPLYALAKKLLERISWQRKGADLYAILDLGGRREMAGLLNISGVVAPLLLMGTAARVAAVPAPVLVAPAAVPAGKVRDNKREAPRRAKKQQRNEGTKSGDGKQKV